MPSTASRIAEQVRPLAERAARHCGCELSAVTFVPDGRGWVLRVVIDRDGSVSVNDCARVSRQLSAMLDVEDVIPQTYTLEVSSPGLDRPLRGAGDFRRFTGRRAKVVVEPAVDGQKHFAGQIEGVDADALLFRAEGNKHHRIPLAAIKRAKLDVEF